MSNLDLAPVVLIITAAVLFYAALTDLRDFQIRNELILALISLWFVYVAVLSLGLLAATALAYFPVWHAGMLWDDDGHMTRPDLRSLHGLVRIWTEIGATQQYYPLLHTAFWVQHAIWGDHPLGYHLFTLLLHAGSAVLFALAHLYQGMRGVFTTFIVGVLFSLIRAWTGSLMAPLVAHFITDIVAGFLAPPRFRAALTVNAGRTGNSVPGVSS